MKQAIKVIVEINKPVKVQIEGVGTIAQYEILQKAYNKGLVTHKQKIQKQTIAFSEEFLFKLINDNNLYPKEF